MWFFINLIVLIKVWFCIFILENFLLQLNFIISNFFLLQITADLEIGFKSFREIYTSKVLYDNKNSKIEVTSVSVNIKKLLNIWEFESIDKKSCNVNFFIDIELKNPIINIIFSKFFNYGFDKILNSFEQRARETIKY